MEAKVISEKAADASPAPTAPNVAIIAKDVFALHPKPVPGDSLDPLNWSSFQKHVILAIVMALYVPPA